jgi:hypothetical protein
MANHNFDFNKFERSILTVILPNEQNGGEADDKEKILLVRMPKLSDFEKFAKTQAANGKTSIDDVAEILASILSNNKAGKKITPEYIIETFDIEDIKELMANLNIFLKGLKSDPN